MTQPTRWTRHHISSWRWWALYFAGLFMLVVALGFIDSTRTRVAVGIPAVVGWGAVIWHSDWRRSRG